MTSDGCATFGDGLTRDRPGDPRLRLATAPRLGQVVEVRARIDHDSDTGLRLAGGRYVRERPEFFLRTLRAHFERDLVGEFTFTSALSPNGSWRQARATTLRR